MRQEGSLLDVSKEVGLFLGGITDYNLRGELFGCDVLDVETSIPLVPDICEAGGEAILFRRDQLSGRGGAHNELILIK